MTSRHACQLALCLPLLGVSIAAQAFVVDISGSPPSVYLRVGDGAYDAAPFVHGGDPKRRQHGPVNLVSVEVPLDDVGDGTDRVMTSNATQSHSNYDNFDFCDLPKEVYVGGFHRGNKNAAAGVLMVTAPASLTSASGDTIPFSQISWTSSGNLDDPGTQPFPGGSFSGGTQSLGIFGANTWSESCHTFYYGNDAVVAAGTYTGRVTYTLSVP